MKNKDPDKLARLQKKLKTLQFKIHSIANTSLAGNYYSRFKGNGLEFNEVVPYVAGDEVANIDWNVSARMHAPYIKRFQEERELQLILVVDGSASCTTGSQPRYPHKKLDHLFKNDSIIEIAALIAFSALKNRDKVGLLIFSNQIEKFLPPKKGLPYIMQILKELLYFTPRSPKSNLKIALTFLAKIQKFNGISFLLSDFLFPKNFAPELLQLKKHNQIYAIHFFAAIEKQLPNLGLIETQDVESGKRFLIDSSAKNFSKLYQAAFDERLLKLNAFFKSLQIKSLSLCLGEPYLQKLQRFLKN